MINETIYDQFDRKVNHLKDLVGRNSSLSDGISLNRNRVKFIQDNDPEKPEILFVTSYPPRECGIATYSRDLIKALTNKFSNSFSISVCALESGVNDYSYPGEVKFVLNTLISIEYKKAAIKISADKRIKIVVIQHEFGFFSLQEKAFLEFLHDISKPVIMVFHTVLPHPDKKLKLQVRNIASSCDSIVVMTKNSAKLLEDAYDVPGEQIDVIAHGTHLVPHLNRDLLKKKYGLTGRKILTTFGLLSSGKSIETTLKALPEIVKSNPEILFLVIGKTHPEVVKAESEKYRTSLEKMVTEFNLTSNVRFINRFLALPDLLEFLQLTDIYLFTSNDANQAVSGTFVYAMSCGCPIISTPIPHAKELLTDESGIIFDFNDSEQLAIDINRLLGDERLRKNISSNALQKIVSTVWENSAVAHAILFEKFDGNKSGLMYNLPVINLNHLKQMTTETGMIQFSKINQPDPSSGYTIDDNARALIAMCMYYCSTHNESSLHYIQIYLNLIGHSQQPGGDFLNYIAYDGKFSSQNQESNLDDSNGRAIWALGYIVSKKGILPDEIINEADAIFRKALPHIETIYSPRAMAFAVKGLYLYDNTNKISWNINLLKILANRLVQMYRHESNDNWDWFESYLTYANCILPEAMLYAWLVTGESIYKNIAVLTLDFLLSKTFTESFIEVISNRKWLHKGEEQGHFGEQPIDVAYTIMTLSNFYQSLHDKKYYLKMETAFNWFLGNNRLHQIIYNPCTGGCYDGLEDTHVNLNQGAESTISYLLARLTIENDVNRIRNSVDRTRITLGKKLRKEKISVHPGQIPPGTSNSYSTFPDLSVKTDKI